MIFITTKCSICNKTPVIINCKYNGQKLCHTCFNNSIEKKVLQTIKKQKLITKGDKVLVALSGGKDSVALIKILNILKERRIIELEALTIDEGISGYRKEGVRIAKETTEKLGIKHHIVSFKEKYNFTIDSLMEKESKKEYPRHACTYCGVFRRQIFNQVARDINATKLATGHNLDDETQSIMMNYMEGNINNMVRIGYKTQSSDEKFTVKIKPLREIPEKELGLYVLENNFEVHFDGCPYARHSFRMEIGDFIREINQKHPTIMYSTLNGFEKIKPAIKEEFIKKENINKTHQTCSICGEPSSDTKCKACKFLDEIYDN